jgi:hypothetical protein
VKKAQKRVASLPAEGKVRLSWDGKGASAPVRPVGRLGTVSKGSATLRLVQGDNLEALSALAPELRAKVTLAYLDPPFFTGRVHEKLTRGRDDSGKVLRATSPAFDDRWSDLPSYLGSLRERLLVLRELIAPEGCAVVHVDTRTSHYVKVLCDEIFGEEAFASEIVWRYRRWPSKTPNFQRVHDVLLRYVKDPVSTPRFVQLFEPLAPSTRLTWGSGKQRAIVGGDGRRTRSSTTEEPSPGAPLGDVWDIGIGGGNPAPRARIRAHTRPVRPRPVTGRRPAEHPSWEGARVRAE